MPRRGEVGNRSSGEIIDARWPLRNRRSRLENSGWKIAPLLGGSKAIYSGERSAREPRMANYPSESSQGRLVGRDRGAAVLAQIYTGPNVTGNGDGWGRGVPRDVFAFTLWHHGDSAALETADRDGREGRVQQPSTRLPVIAGAVNPPATAEFRRRGLDQGSCRAPLLRIGGSGCRGHD